MTTDARSDHTHPISAIVDIMYWISLPILVFVCDGTFEWIAGILLVAGWAFAEAPIIYPNKSESDPVPVPKKATSRKKEAMKETTVAVLAEPKDQTITTKQSVEAPEPESGMRMVEIEAEVLAALASLGFKKTEAKAMLDKARPLDSSVTPEQILAVALRK